MSWAAWQVHFKDGKKALMLTDQCETIEEALFASFERFGQKRILTVTTNDYAKSDSTTPPELPVTDFMRI